MTQLKQFLIRRIKTEGPMSVAAYMAECLFNPKHGYYVKNEPFGADGDFITAPDISQMFGELTASWLIQAWQDLGKPNPVTLCEIGPGRGVWMQDIVNTISKLQPDMCDALDVILIEKSANLAASQTKRLKNLAIKIKWLDDFSDLPNNKTLFIANELFDALPIRQYVKTNQAWLDRVIALDADDNFTFVEGTGSLSDKLLPLNAAAAAEGTIFEYAPAREALAQQIAEHINQHGGAALLIDYGHGKSDLGDTLQAVRDHVYEDVFANPGDADLTSHVDFEALNIAAKMGKAQTHQIVSQADFLLAMGLVERAGALGSDKDSRGRDEITAAVHRLAGNAEDQMGDLFKVMCITQRGQPTPMPFQKL
ncbi:MAG: class I SAM-dependent methyltransferase [Pseudomonadota bacterium]